MSDWAGLAWLFVLLLANAFFVGAEFAVISARRSQIEPLAEQGRRSAKTALWAMEHATLMLAMSQLGITICSLLILNVSEPAIHHLLEVPLLLEALESELHVAEALTAAALDEEVGRRLHEGGCAWSYSAVRDEVVQQFFEQFLGEHGGSLQTLVQAHVLRVRGGQPS